MDANKTGKFIADLRKEQNLTQSQLAEKLYVSDKAVSRWETGRGFPDINSLEDLAGTLNVSVAELLKGERISENISREEVNDITTSGLTLFKGMLHSRRALGILAGFVLSLVVLVILLVYLNSPIHLQGSADALKVEKLSEGRVVAIMNPSAAGIDIEKVKDPDTGYVSTFVSCYDTVWHRLFEKKQETIVTLGQEAELGNVYYYPGLEEDELIYSLGRKDYWQGVVTLPRLVYHYWIMLGVVLTIIGIILYLALRKTRFRKRMHFLMMLPVAFTVSMLVLLLGKRNIYNATYYFTGILLLAFLIYGLLWILYYLKTVKTTKKQADNP